MKARYRGAKARLRRATIRSIARRHQTAAVRRALLVADFVRRCAENHSYDIAANGELWLLERIGLTGPTCLFDVGANVGDWAAAARSFCPKAEVHAFEVVPDTANRLGSRFESDPQVIVNGIGLLDCAGTVRIKHYPEMPVLSSLRDFPHSAACSWIEGSVTTGDEYCQSRGIQHIDFLKVDAEGVDHQVLGGFQRMLSQRAIDVVQFEYGLSAIETHFLLADFYEMLTGNGYIVGKLYPDHVDLRPYDMQDENFIGPNYVAISAGQEALAAALSRRV